MRGARRYGLAAAGAAAIGYGAYRLLKRRPGKRVMGSKHTDSKKRSIYLFGDKTSEAGLANKQMELREVQMTQPLNTLGSTLHRQIGPGYKLLGFKICGTFRNTSDSLLRSHLILFQFKDNTENALAEWWENFFVNKDSTISERHVNFANRLQIVDPFTGFAVGGPPQPEWNQDQNCGTINPDKFNIIKHWRFDLFPRTAGAGPGNTLNTQRGTQTIKMIDTYIKVGKNFVYETDNNTSPVRPIYMMFWYDSVTARGDPAINMTANLHVVGYTGALKSS